MNGCCFPGLAVHLFPPQAQSILHLGFGPLLTPLARTKISINSLLLCADPALTPRDQLVLATIALEALLLPEVRSQLKSTFAGRLATSLPASHYASDIEQIARFLYDARSAALHGTEPEDIETADILKSACGAQQLLAVSILALGPSVLSGVPLAQLREQLDAGSAPERAILASPLDLDSSPRYRSKE